MDRRELEKLMDKYRQEMLEFQRKNNLSGYSSTVKPIEAKISSTSRWTSVIG